MNPGCVVRFGERGRIGTGIYERIGTRRESEIKVPPGAGLIPNFNALRGPGFDPTPFTRDSPFL